MRDVEEVCRAGETHRRGRSHDVKLPVPLRARVAYAEPGSPARVPQVQKRELGQAEAVRAGQEGLEVGELVRSRCAVLIRRWAHDDVTLVRKLADGPLAL